VEGYEELETSADIRGAAAGVVSRLRWRRGSDYDCPVFPPAASFPYILPWQIGESRVANPHIARGDSGTQRYAIDVPMPIGTQVFAIRSGVNFVLVRHDDGTVARYAHLTFMGTIVQLGDGVAQGQLIALSGNTGRSTAPHLHFDVTTDCCTPNPDGLPIGQSVPLNFRNAEAVPGTGDGMTDLSCGLRPGVSYTALPF
jgi:murein DD-endopeptidase MepM/ murein hydrolase activator NlpD